MVMYTNPATGVISEGIVIESAPGVPFAGGTGGGSNPAASLTGAAAPTSASLTGYTDAGGLLQPVSAATPMPTTSSAIGAIGDAAWAAGNGTVIAVLKGIFGKFSGTALIGKVSLQTAAADVSAANPLPITDASAPVTGAVMPAGGTGQQGWLSWLASNLASALVGTAPGNASAQAMLMAAVYNAAGIGLADTQSAALQLDKVGNLKVAVQTPAGPDIAPSTILALATTNLTSLKAAPCGLKSLCLTNAAAYAVYMKLYNKNSAPVLATDTPVWTIGVPAGATVVVTPPQGISFTAGLSYAITKLPIKTDTTAVVAGDLTGILSVI